MKIRCHVLFNFLIFAVSFAAISAQSINFQGYLTDKNGQAISGKRNIRFNYYDTASGGIPLAGLSQDALKTRQVAVSVGNYATKLNLTDADQSIIGRAGDVWLEVAVDGVTMNPRIQLAMVLFAGNVRGIRINAKNEVTSATLNATILNTGTIRGGTMNVSVIDYSALLGCRYDGGTVSAASGTFSGNINSEKKIQEHGLDFVPPGTIAIWSGTRENIPAGWMEYTP